MRLFRKKDGKVEEVKISYALEKWLKTAEEIKKEMETKKVEIPLSELEPEILFSEMEFASLKKKVEGKPDGFYVYFKIREAEEKLTEKVDTVRFWLDENGFPEISFSYEGS